MLIVDFAGGTGAGARAETSSRRLLIPNVLLYRFLFRESLRLVTRIGTQAALLLVVAGSLNRVTGWHAQLLTIRRRFSELFGMHTSIHYSSDVCAL